jgi:hypothetical protein
MAKSMFFLIALLLVAIFSIITSTAIAPIVYAQEGGMMKTTSKGTLDIRLDPVWTEGGQGQFTVSFLNPGTDTPHEHQDYDVRILKDGQQVFSAANQTGQAILHNVEGTVTVPTAPFTFQQNGDYTIQVYLAATGISPPIPTDEEATFSINVTPEFPAGVLPAALAVFMTTAIFLTQRFRLV